jgi:hypothetical protein
MRRRVLRGRWLWELNMAEKQSSLLQGIDVAPKAKGLSAAGAPSQSTKNKVLIPVTMVALAVGGYLIFNSLAGGSDTGVKPLPPTPEQKSKPAPSEPVRTTPLSPQEEQKNATPVLLPGPAKAS